SCNRHPGSTLEVNNAVVAHPRFSSNTERNFLRLRRQIQHDFAALALYDAEAGRLPVLLLRVVLASDSGGLRPPYNLHNGIITNEVCNESSSVGGHAMPSGIGDRRRGRASAD